MAEHVMIDLETLGKGNEAVIVSIGAVKFDPQSLGIIERFHVGVDPESCTQFGLKLDASTVMWWMSEDRADARKQLWALGRVDLATALEGFSHWMGGDKPVWGNGATFDLVILSSAYRLIGLDRPWGYKNERCFRTFRALAPDMKIQDVGTAHNAVDDAHAQALHVQAINHALNTVIN
jgi:hypothetical protein